IGLLLALLYALTNHSRHQELTAIRSAGVSLWRLAMPYFGVGLLFTVALFAVNEFVVPETTEAADQILNRYEASSPAVRTRWVHKFGVTNTRRHRTWLAEAYNLVTHEMISPHVVWTLETGTAWVIDAKRAFYVDGAWIFTNAQERIFPAIRGAF